MASHHVEKLSFITEPVFNRARLISFFFVMSWMLVLCVFSKMALQIQGVVK